MIKIIDKSKCCGCRACLSVCKEQCISMHIDSEGFLYPTVNSSECINCGLCENNCSISRSDNTEVGEIFGVYGASVKDDMLKESSSSGGLFGALAKNILSAGGVVFGASFSDDFKAVRHICIESESQLMKLQGSKYLQSDIGETFNQTELYLKRGRPVLFSGTPCQIAGLKTRLKKDYDNLITLDVICHGVPSQKVWEKYVEYRESQAGSSVQDVSFRNKKNGWKNFSLSIKFSNKKEYVKKITEDPYMQAFLRNYSLRPSCYQCAFKKGKSGSDITLADYWGVTFLNPELDDDKGTSLVLVHSDKGQKLFDEISAELNYKSVDFNKAMKYNPAYNDSVKMPERRKSFFDDLEVLGFDILYKKYLRDSASVRLKKAIKTSFIWRLMRKIIKGNKRKNN